MEGIQGFFSKNFKGEILRKLRGVTWKYDRIDHTHLRGGAKPLSGRRGGGELPPLPPPHQKNLAQMRRIN